MTINDPISDMIIRIKNAALVNNPSVNIPMSKIKKAILTVLRDQGYISDFFDNTIDGKDFITVNLKYFRDKDNITKHVIKSFTRMSKPSCRSYSSSKDLPLIKGGLGVCIVSTPLGVMTGKEARHRNLGGELIAEVF